MGQEAVALQMRGISKTFNKTVHALENVDFTVAAGEIHGLVGENGAGKSTLMNILGGVLNKDTGSIKRKGVGVDFHTTQDARDNAISFIHQELNLVPDLRVYENIFLGEEIRNRFGFIDVNAMCSVSEQVLKRMAVDISPMSLVRDLNATMKQVVEIGRAVHQKSDLIIMDEPTTSLTDHEIEHLFTIMRTLKDQGVSIIFISHKLNEVLNVCDSYTVLRDGRVTGTGRVESVTEEDIVRLMVGRELLAHDFYQTRQLGETVLEVDDLSSKGAFRNVSFTLKEGEVLGFTGLIGDGRSELFESIFGYRKYESGQILKNGKPVHVRHPRDANRLGIGYAPKDRKENAIIHGMSIIENITLPSLKQFSSGLVVRHSLEKKSAAKQVDRLHIKLNDADDPIDSLSGGNQQKVVLAKWLEADSDIIVLDNPTQGIDVGAKSEIYDLVMELANAGKSIIILTSEFGEIMKLCDRVIVLFHGDVVGNIPREAADEETLMMYTTGVKRESAGAAGKGDGKR
jgi:ribose transport system ATP-binding protein